MLRNGALPRRDSCDSSSPKSDDSAKKCVPSAEMSSFKSESYGVPITFASPRSREALLDFMVATIQAKDLRTCSVLVMCQQAAEARHVKSEMGKRNINTMLLDADHPTTRHMVRLWAQGYIQQVIIACDDHLKLLEGIPVHFVIHTALPPVQKFKERLNILTKSENKAEILAFIETPEEAESLQSKPKMGNVVAKPKNGKTPKMAVKPLNNNPVEAAKKPLNNNPEEAAKKPLNNNPEEASKKSLNNPEEAPKKPVNNNPEEAGAILGKNPVNNNLKEAFNKPIYKLLEGAYKKPSNINSIGTSPVVWSDDALTRGKSFPKDVPVAKSTLIKSVSQESVLEGWHTPPEHQPVDVVGLQRQMEGLTMEAPSPRTSSLDSAGSTADSETAAGDGEKGTTRSHYGVLAWSRELILPCYDLKGVLDLNPSIRDTMMTLMEDMRDKQARGLHKYAWPHVSLGKSLVAVGPEKIGKTWCFLPRLCQRTHEQMLLCADEHHGPTSIVVCHNQQQGNQIVQWLTKLFAPLSTGDRKPDEEVVTLWEKGNINEVVDRLSHSVGILVTTPDLLMLLKELNTKEEGPIFNADSIKCVALDNLSDMMRHLPDTTAKMVDWLVQFLDFNAEACQLFVTTRLWPKALMQEGLLPHMPDVLIVFRDALEASIYRKLKLEVNMTKPGDEIRAVVALLRGRTLDKERIVVSCQSKEESLKVKDRLEQAGIRAEAIYDDGGLPTVNQWRVRTLPTVLLITDEIVDKVKCGPIDQLIHYTAASSWMRFKFRFTLFYNNYVSTAAAGCRGKSVVLQQNSEHDRLWLLADFMIWHQLPRPAWLHFIADRRQMYDYHTWKIAKLPLCEHLSSYGNCIRRSCRYRHQMWQEEVQPPANCPTEGDFSFHVLACNSPVQFSVRLNEVYPSEVAFFGSLMSQLAHEIHLHYEQEENRRHHVQPRTGDIVIVKNLKRYERVVVTRRDDKKITVRLLDSGVEYLTYNESQLFACEERHQNEPAQGMEVRVMGIEPQPLDRIWTKDMRDVVRNGFFTRTDGKRTRIYSARVLFVMGRTIFVQTVIDDEGQDLRSFLLDRCHVHEEATTLEKLVEIAAAAQPYPKRRKR